MKRNIILFLMAAVVAAIAVKYGMGDATFFYGVALFLYYAAKPYLSQVTLGIDDLVRGDGDIEDKLEGLAKDLGDATKKLTKQQDDLKDAHKEIMGALEKSEKLAKDKQDNIDQAISKANETATVVSELSQKIDEIKKSALAGPKSALTMRGELLKSLEGESKDRYASLLKGESRSLRMVMKEITSADVSTGVKREPYIDSLISLERQPLRIRNLLTVVPVQTDAVKYGKQTLRDNKARIVAEGTSKPYSNYKWEDATATIETIAHLAKLTLQALADAPRLAAEVEAEMRFGLAMAEEAEILNGDGTSGHLSGLMDNATAYAVPAGMDAANVLTQIDRLRVAMLQIHLAYAVPDAHVLNPINVAEIDLLRRDPDKGGGYLFGNPDGETGINRLWRLPVVESPSMVVNEFLTGAFKYSVHLYDRAGVAVAISTENDDDFETNKATMRCESRIGLGVRRPYGLVAGNLKGGS